MARVILRRHSSGTMMIELDICGGQETSTTEAKGYMEYRVDISMCGVTVQSICSANMR